MSRLEKSSVAYKPFYYPWAVEFAKEHEDIHWTENEVDLKEDVKQWKSGDLTEEEKNHITQTLRLFTTSDVEVGANYYNHFIPRFKNNEVRNMLGSFAARECFDEETELLTSDGWVNVKNVDENTKLAQYNMEENYISYSLPNKVMKYQHNGVMHHYSGKNFDLCVTPEHEILLINPHSGKIKKKKSSEGKWSSNFFCPVSAKTLNSKNLSEKEELTLRMLVMTQADANIKSQAPWAIANRPNEKRIYLNLKKERKIERAYSLLNSLSKYFDLNISTKERGDFKVIAFSMPGCIDQSKIKDFSFIKLDNISSSEIEVILDELKYWDSTIQDNSSEGSFVYYSSNKEAIDKISAIATMHGKYRTVSRISRLGNKNFNKQIANNDHITKETKTSYAISFVKRDRTIYPNRTEVPYDGYVYCVDVPFHNVVTRRNGKVCFSGNSIHQRAYALINDTLGFDDAEFVAFKEYAEMMDKVEFMQDNCTSTVTGTALALAKSMFNEGVILFASFAMLLHYQRYGKMKGMCTVVEWSIRDEEKHCEGIAKLFRTYCDEHPKIVNDEFKKKIYDMAREVVKLEDKFIDLAFEMGIEGLEKEDVKQYIRFITDRRLVQIGLKPNFEIEENPLDWITYIVNGKDHSNFFEKRVTEYQVDGMGDGDMW
jgi:ribonucleotide reductase beta subunit family protein with ferritin-like domain